MSMREESIMGEQGKGEIEIEIEGNENENLMKKTKKSCEFIETILELKDQVLDLKFIVNHLKEDILCTLETSKKTLQFTNEQEIGVLVHSMMEEFLKEKFSLINCVNNLKKENLFLIENEEGIMDELAKITLEHEQLTITINNKDKDNTEMIKEEIVGLESELELAIMEGNCVINNLKKEKEEDKEIIKCLKEDQMKLKDKLEQFKTDLRERVIEVEKLKGGILKTKNLLKSENEKRLKLEEEIEIRDKKIVENNRINFEMINEKELEHVKSITEHESLYKNMNFNYEKLIEEKDQVINEQISRLKELMEINIELMDLSESVKGKQKELERRNENYRNEIERMKLILSRKDEEIKELEGESECLKCKNETLENETNFNLLKNENYSKKTDSLLEEVETLKEEIKILKKDSEHLRKLSTAQKIELEKSKEIISREKRMSSLKISDLEEQLENSNSKVKAMGEINDLKNINDYTYSNNDIDTTCMETDESESESDNDNDNDNGDNKENNKLTQTRIFKELTVLNANVKDNIKLTTEHLDDPFLEAKVRLAHLEASSSSNTKEECLQQ